MFKSDCTQIAFWLELHRVGKYISDCLPRQNILSVNDFPNTAHLRRFSFFYIIYSRGNFCQQCVIFTTNKTAEIYKMKSKIVITISNHNGGRFIYLVIKSD